MLGVNSVWWGYEVFSDLIKGIEWPETGNFPRVTLCDFSVAFIRFLSIFSHLYCYTPLQVMKFPDVESIYQISNLGARSR